MPRTTQCPSCGVVLNLPDRARSGKHLRCPKCGTRFVLSAEDANSESTLLGSAERQWAKSNHDLAARPPSIDDLPVPAMQGDLRETFDLPLAGGARDLERSSEEASRGIADAASLLDDRSGPKRKTSAADARSRARRCVRCGGLVQQGMSICVSCGTDQETGMHVGLDDDLVPPPPPRPSGPPLHIAIVGGLCGAAAIVLLVLSLVNSVGGTTGDWKNYGWLGLALVSGFSIYGAVQFVRGKSVKLLMAALTLAAVINMAALVVMPIIVANFGAGDQTVTQIDSGDNPELIDIAIKPVEAELDAQMIKVGIGLTMVYAALSWYLMSPPVRRYFHLQLRSERAIG